MLKTEVANLLLKKYGKNNAPELRAGDTVRVHQKIREGEKERIQIFEGLVIAVKHGRGLDGTFTVRKIASGSVGVERTYPLHSPVIVKVERTKTAKVSRAKLYYMRDRMGKNARFRNESNATATSWIENEVVEEAPAAEVAGEDTTDQIEAAVIETAAEQETEIKAEETAEVAAAVEAAVDAEEEVAEATKENEIA